MDRSDPTRDAFHAFMQEQGPRDLDGKDAVLVGWVVVQDWMDEDGDRWLTKAHSASLPVWAAAGLHNEALHGEWADREESDDPE